MSAMTKAEKELEKVRGTLGRMRERVKTEGESIMETGVGVVAAIGMGAADAKWGEDAIFGMSIPMAVGVTGLVADLSGAGGSFSPVLRAAGRAGVHIEGFRWGGRKFREWDTEDGGEG